jgi:uncharacterized membrane protein YgcG
MVVQHENVNIADERPIEYALWDQDVPCFRVEYREVLERTWYPLKDQPYTNKDIKRSDDADEYRARYMKNRTRTLLFAPFAPLSAHPDVHPSDIDPRQGQGEVFEISVIYYRSSLTAFELAPGSGFMIRLHLERSTAVKCPSVLGQLAASKKVQLALSKPGVLERFLPTDQADRLRQGNVKMYDLTEGSAGRAALEETINGEGQVDLDNVVLKPLSTEGGSHNIFPPASNISSFYEKNIQPFGAEGGYMLMEMIRSPAVPGVLISGNHIREQHIGSGSGRKGRGDGGGERGKARRERGGGGSGNGGSRLWNSGLWTGGLWTGGLWTGGLYVGPVVCELGVLGGVIYRRMQTQTQTKSNDSKPPPALKDGSPGSSQSMLDAKTEIIHNEVHGTTLKSKPPDVKEMNVIKGSGCFGTVWLVDWDEYCVYSSTRVP